MLRQRAEESSLRDDGAAALGPRRAINEIDLSTDAREELGPDTIRTNLFQITMNEESDDSLLFERTWPVRSHSIAALIATMRSF